MKFWIYDCSQNSPPYDEFAIVRVDNPNLSKDDCYAMFFTAMLANNIWTDCEYIDKKDIIKARDVMKAKGWKEEYIFRLENTLK